MTQKLPAGIAGNGIEIFRDDEWRVFYLQNGNKLPYLMMPSECRAYFQTELAGDLTVLNVIKHEFGLDSADEIEEAFVGCRYGNLDYRADLLDGKLTPDAPRCNRISFCVGFNIVCRIPIPPNGHFTRKEYQVLYLICKGKQAKEIADILSISENTARTHTQRIHAKLGVNNNAEVGMWAHELRII